LQEYLRTVKCKFILSYNIDEYIKSLYSWCTIYGARKSVYKQEYYITNFDISWDEMHKLLGGGKYNIWLEK